mgnify:CR=1 FL=1
MLKKRKILGLAAGLAVLMAAMPSAVSAKPTSGLDIIPVIDQNFWLAESRETSNLSLDREGGYASATFDENGAITVKRTEDARAMTVSIHSAPAEMRLNVNLKENPYVYFDLTCNTSWKITMVINNQSVNIAPGIVNAVAGSEEIRRQSQAGEAGTYQGKFNLYEYLSSSMVTREIPALEGGVKSCRAPQIYLTLVDNTEDHLSGELTVRQLSIGNDDENAEDGLKVSGELATGSEEDFADMETDNTTPDPSRLIFADGATATQGGTDSTNSAGGSGSGASDSADNTTVLYIVIAAVCVVVVAGVIVAVVLSRKKKAGPKDTDDQVPKDNDPQA